MRPKLIFSSYPSTFEEPQQEKRICTEKVLWLALLAFLYSILIIASFCLDESQLTKSSFMEENNEKEHKKSDVSTDKEDKILYDLWDLGEWKEEQQVMLYCTTCNSI